MTLAEKIAETHPADVSAEYEGGVNGCPSWYMVTKYAPRLCRPGKNEDCNKCWSQEWNAKYQRDPMIDFDYLTGADIN